VLAGQVVSGLLGLAVLRILTVLSPSHLFGEASLWIGLIILGRDVFVTPIANSQIRFYPEYQSTRRLVWFNRRIRSLTIKALIVCGLTITIGYCVWRAIEGISFRPSLLLVLLLFLIATASKNLRINPLYAERMQRISSTWNTFEAAAMLFFSALFIFCRTSTEAYLLGQAVGCLTAFLVFGCFCYPNLQADASLEADGPADDFSQRVLTYGFPFIPLTILTWAFMLGDRYILAMKMGAADVGQYAAVFSIASSPFIMLSSVCTTAFRPVLFDSASRNARHKSTGVMWVWVLTVLCVSVAGMLCFWIFGAFLSRLLLAEQYRAGAPTLFLWVACGFAFYALTQAMENGLLSNENSRGILPPTIIGAFVSLLFTLILVPRFGILGAVQAKALGTGIQLLATARAYAIACRKAHKKTV